MSVLVIVFISVGGRAFSSFLKLVFTTNIFHYFSLVFSTGICKSSFLLLLPLKSQNNGKFYKMTSKICKDICISSMYNSLSEFNSKFLLFAPHSKYCFSNPLCLFLQIKYLIILKYNCSIQLHSSLIINIQITLLNI